MLKLSSHYSAGRISTYYLVIGAIWIFFNEQILSFWIGSLSYARLPQDTKCIVLLLLSAAALYLLLRWLNQIQASWVNRYRQLFHDNPLPMWIYETKTMRILEVNQAAEMQYGYSREEFLQMTLKDIRPREDWVKLRKAVRTSPPTYLYSGTWQHLTKSGEKIYMDITSNPINYKGKKARLVMAKNVSKQIAYEQEITQLNETLEEKALNKNQALFAQNQELSKKNEKLKLLNEELQASNHALNQSNHQLQEAQETIEKQAKRLVQQSQYQLNQILHNLKDLVWSVSLDMKTLFYGSNASEALYGYPSEVFMQDPSLWSKLVHPEDLPKVLKQFQLVREKGYSEVSFRINRHDGVEKWLLNRMWLVQDEAGQALRVDGITSDITERKNAEREIIHQKETLQTLLDHLPLMIALFNPQRKLEMANKTWQTTLNRSVMAAAISPDQMPLKSEGKSVDFAQDLLSRTDDSWRDYPITTATEEQLATSWIKVKLPQQRTVLIGQDITERKKAEEEKNLLIKQFGQQNEDLIQFSYIVSHNLRAPVANILGLINIIDYQQMSGAHNQQILNYLMESAQKLDSVVEDINGVLEVKNHLSEPREKINLHRLLEHVASELQAETRESQAQIVHQLEKIAEVYSIRAYLHSIFHNLISNAIKYRSPEREARIVVRTSLHKGYIKICVEDNGLGIDLQKHREKLFALYQRFHFHQKGKGLGLYLVKTHVEALEGHIEVHSEVDKGSCFEVFLPLEEAG